MSVRSDRPLTTTDTLIVRARSENGGVHVLLVAVAELEGGRWREVFRFPLV